MTEDYPFLEIDDRLRDAADLLDEADDVLGEVLRNPRTGEPEPLPADVERAQELWRQGWELIGRARTEMKELVRSERERYSHDEEYWSRDK
jgi:hypothetical protein